MSLTLIPLKHIPLIQSGDNLPEILFNALLEENVDLIDGDILAVTQKIISKAENRAIFLGIVQPTVEAEELALKTGKDSRLIQLILNESNEIIRANPSTIIVEHRLGFICANAGIDHSNVKGDFGPDEEWFLLLPENPEKTAEKIRNYLKKKTKKEIGVIIIDSHGRPWRYGTVGICIGTAGVPALVDLRGYPDMFGYKLKITKVAAADELAAACSLIMGQADEKIPAVHIRGFPYLLRQSSIKEILREKENDLFR